MTALRLCCVCLLCVLLLCGCGGPTVVGRYRIEQTNQFLGEGAEKGELELKEDKSFEITMGTLRLASGTYILNGNQIELSAGTGKLGTSYKILNDKLIPLVSGKEITAWRFARK